MVERGLGIFVFSAVSAHIPRKLLGKLFGDSGSINMFDTPQEKYEISQERNPRRFFSFSLAAVPLLGLFSFSPLEAFLL